MKRIITYSVLSCFLFVFTQCTPPGQETEGEAQVAVEGKIQPVNTHILEMSTIDQTIEYTGNLTAFKENYLSSSAPGRIEKIYIEIGDRVQKGQVLVQLDRTQLHQAQVQLQNLRVDFQRLDTLNKVGGIPTQQYDQMKAQIEVAESNVAFLKENTRLESPISGLVTARHFEDGEMFSGAPNTQAGKAAIVTLMQLNPMKVLISVSESYYPRLKRGMRAEIRCAIYPDRIFEGKIFKVHPTVNPATRSFTVEITMDNRRELLRPGMYSRVSIHLGGEEALVVPLAAVLQQEGTNNRYVFVHKNGMAKRKDVTLGKRYDDRVVIASGNLKPGDRLITSGHTNLMDGQKVEVVRMLP